MKKHVICAIVLLCMAPQPQAASPRKRKKAKTEQTQQTPVVETAPVQTIPVERPPRIQPVAGTETVPVELSPEAIDSLAACWQTELTIASYDRFFKDFITVEGGEKDGPVPDSIYVKRLQALVSPVKLSYNDLVRARIERYTRPGSGEIARILGLSRYYFPMFEQELIRAGLPVELRALAIIESALSPTVVSHAGAAGLWQFMPVTGKYFGLEINSLVDERRDPLLSTRAACQYLLRLHRMFKDWTLAIAAYNCGEGNVSKAIARAGGGKKTFWDIYEYLPRETRDYVPAFIAASYAYAYHQQHGIKGRETPMPLATDTVHVTRLVHLGQVAEVLGMKIETLRTLNPQYVQDIIPATIKSYSLTLPREHLTRYIARQQEIQQLDSVYLKEYLAEPEAVQKKVAAAAVTPTYKTYTVKSGDTLGGIAGRNKVTVAQLMKWNKIKNPHKLSLGQKLRIEVRK